jgi:hypothetical protein
MIETVPPRLWDKQSSTATSIFTRDVKLRAANREKEGFIVAMFLRRNCATSASKADLYGL